MLLSMGASPQVMTSNQTSELWTPAKLLEQAQHLRQLAAKGDGSASEKLEDYPHHYTMLAFRSRSGGNEWEPLTKGLPQKDCYVNVLRDAMAVDSLDKCGIYFGTTGGQVYGSSDAGDSWNAIARDLPAVFSVEAQTLR